MKSSLKLLYIIGLTLLSYTSFAQQHIEKYNPLKNDSIRVGTGDKDILPYIQSGYKLMKPETDTIKGVLIFLEDSEYDNKNKSAKQIYTQASENNFAVLSVSTEIPLDFYFTKYSILSAHKIIQDAFTEHELPNDNIFFLGASLTGHRAMQYIKFMQKAESDFKLNIKGIVMCNFTLDWTRKWQQHQRDIKLNRINLWEPKFINYMLETHLKGTPKTAREQYHEFSPYSFSDEDNRNIEAYKNYAIRAYAEPAIKYRLERYYRTLYENNVTDIVGFLAEQKLAGNDNTELIVIQPEKNTVKERNAQSTWPSIDKEELMDWIMAQTEQ